MVLNCTYDVRSVREAAGPSWHDLRYPQHRGWICVVVSLRWLLYRAFSDTLQRGIKAWRRRARDGIRCAVTGIIELEIELSIKLPLTLVLDTGILCPCT